MLQVGCTSVTVVQGDVDIPLRTMAPNVRGQYKDSRICVDRSICDEREEVHGPIAGAPVAGADATTEHSLCSPACRPRLRFSGHPPEADRDARQYKHRDRHHRQSDTKAHGRGHRTN